MTEEEAIRAAIEQHNARTKARREAEQRDYAVMLTLATLAPKCSARGRRLLYAFHAGDFK